MKVTLTSPAATQALAEKMGELAQAGTIIFLNGDLGAGKTTFTKGFARGLNIREMIKSPSYTIIREYEKGRLPFYHMDLYRLAGDNDELGLEEYFESDGVSVIEWANLLEEVPADYLTLTFSKTGDDARVIEFVAVGDQSSRYLAKIQEVATWK